MPIKYAVSSENPESDWPEKGRLSYLLASQAEAEADPANGFYAVFTNLGEQATSWQSLEWKDMLDADIAKIRPFPSLDDMLGVPLNIGDYAASAFDERSNYLSICKVVGFTKDKVRVILRGRLVSRKPSLLLRVHESVITPDYP